MNDDLNELSAEARALLSQARGGDDPAPSDRGRVHRALMASLAGGAGIAASSAASSAAASATATAATGLTASLTVKIAAVVLVVGAVSGTVAVAPWEEAEDAPAARAAPVTHHGASSEAAIDEAAIDEAAIDEAAIDEPAPTRAQEPVPEIQLAPIDEPIRADEIAPPMDSVTPAAQRAPPGVSVRRTPRVVASTESAPAQGDPPASPSTFAEEMGLLRSAQSALNAGDPATALARLTEHARRFPDGAMVEERDAARILALCRADRRDDARAAAARFLRERPTSPLAARVRSSCE